MKDKIHPKFYDAAAVECACGNKFTVGSTLEHIKVEVCHKCHPFFTGKSKLIDVGGRVERFRARLSRTEALKKSRPATKTSKKKAK